MKLVSMVSYVKQQEKRLIESSKSRLKEFSSQYLDRIINYANFLNQPLELGMFICEVPEPEIQGGYSPDGDFIGGFCEEWVKAYEEAKNRVLFEGFEICNRNGRKDCIVCDDEHILIKWLENNTIEYLVKYNLTLTDNTIKQIGL